MTSRRSFSHSACCLAVTAIAATVAPAWADDAAVGVAALPNRSVEVPWNSGRPNPAQAPRATVEVDSHLPAAGSSLAPPLASLPTDKRSVSVRYVRWAPAGRAGAVGVSMGVAAETPAAQPFAVPTDTGRAQPQLGVRWRTDWHAQHRVDVAAWGAYDPSANTPLAERRSYNARVELQFQAAKRAMGMDFSHAALGMQLSSKSQMLLRANHGGPMVYYRTQW